MTTRTAVQLMLDSELPMELVLPSDGDAGVSTTRPVSSVSTITSTCTSRPPRVLITLIATAAVGLLPTSCRWRIVSAIFAAASSAVTISGGHPFQNGDAVYLTTTGALPTGLTASTTYFIIKNDADSFWLATSLANAAAGTKIATSGSQSGTHTAVAGAIDLTLSKAFA